MTDEPRVYMRHVRAAGLCGPGMARIAERYGLNLLDFLENGVELSRAENHTNPLIRKVAALARAEWERKNGKV